VALTISVPLEVLRMVSMMAAGCQLVRREPSVETSTMKLMSLALVLRG